MSGGFFVSNNDTRRCFLRCLQISSNSSLLFNIMLWSAARIVSFSVRRRSHTLIKNCPKLYILNFGKFSLVFITWLSTKRSGKNHQRFSSALKFKLFNHGYFFKMKERKWKTLENLLPLKEQPLTTNVRSTVELGDRELFGHPKIVP